MSAARNWWPQQCLLAWLNLVFTAPVIYLYVGLPLVLRQHGWSGLDIGLLQLAGLPAILKFLLAAPVDRWRLGRASYRNWGMLLGLAYAGALWLMGVHDLGRSSYAQLFTLAMLVSLLGTWVDVPVNALAIQMLPPAQRMRAGALRSAATSLGAIVGGGLALMLYDQGGWAWPFQALALAVLSGVLLAPWLGAGQAPQPEAPAAPAGGLAGIPQGLAWFGAPAHRVWAVFLVLYYPSIGAVWVYLKPLMLDQGFAPGRIAWIVGILGGLVAALASLAAARLSRGPAAAAALPWFGGFNLLAIAALAVATLGQLGPQALTAAAMLIAAAMGTSAGLVFGLMMYHARPGLAALDYGLQSSLFVVGRTAAPVAAGALLDLGGYGLMLGSLVGATTLVWLMALRGRRRILAPGAAGR
ncbi:muropeptide transporter [Bordetella trematum]|uniref:MFS transporter n=1 Tax=Bordetella trematum TaxID=123899 RepID=UPI0007929441|nr:MFS transporter [Bordetella trematum]SAH99413.1 muropeptide transporter [Bordetella trematum]